MSSMLMAHATAMVSILFIVACDGDESHSVDCSRAGLSGEGGYSSNSGGAGGGPDPRPATCGPECTRSYAWSSEGWTYDFDGFGRFTPNLNDINALVVDVPDVAPGDELHVTAAGNAYAEAREADVDCTLRAHVLEPGSEGEAPLTTGGDVAFVTTAENANSTTRVELHGVHRATTSGRVRVRVLGRVSKPDRFCGLTGHVELQVTHLRAEVE